MSEQKALESVVSRIEDAIKWARTRTCKPCRSEEGPKCPGCVKAIETADLLAELAADQASDKIIAAPVAAPPPPKPTASPTPCDHCGSGELLLDAEVCDQCHFDRAARKLKPFTRFWEQK